MILLFLIFDNYSHDVPTSSDSMSFFQPFNRLNSDRTSSKVKQRIKGINFLEKR